MTAGGGSQLTARVERRLESGPRHTLEIARGPMGLSGPDGPLAAAVFALLGNDPRFRVDGKGRWSLAQSPDRTSARFAELSFAVVDVETTGGSYARGHRITEIAIVEVVGGEIVDEYGTLVNPGRHIPAAIERLTSITDAMVADAPYFDQIADEVHVRLDGRVFVAHNVGFDWGFVSGALCEATGGAPDVDHLCTVRLARRLLPDLRRRNLDAVTAYFGLEVHGRHRAAGDALATAWVLLRLLDRAQAAGLVSLDALHPTRRRTPDPEPPGPSPR